ncbi:MAG: DUF951 domain-containing protein [Bacilli bacterium]|nr:DUF951 domain-containing protein [Bacilli bacterium]
MQTVINFEIGTILEFKKPHPCGSYHWKVLRSGVDYKLQCEKCGRIIMIPRIDLAKKIKNFK